MQFSTLLGAIAIFSSSALASPVPSPKHVVTSATVTGFRASRNATHINYAATIQVHPEDPPVLFTHSTEGTKVPDVSGFWDSQDPALYFRFNRFDTENNGDNFRLVLSDVHVTGSTVNLDYFSPAKEWEGDKRIVYTGPSSFKLAA